MFYKKSHIFILIVTLLSSLNSYAQLTTNTSQTPTQLVQNVLVGNGVTVTNVVYTGHADAIGSFNGASTNLGLNTGIVLTTGTVLPNTGIFGAQQGPHGPNNNSSAGTDNNTSGYGPLTAIAGEDTYNATILEFDFVPNSDSVKFKYVFASEEYPEFVNAGFNDVFAFFISGPGFGGTYNMATIPGSGGTPVTIDNVNANLNSNFFVNNGDGTSSPQNSSSFYIQYDGFTVVFEASAQVQCGETYHLKIAIADVGDGAYDSGIFLEANSLTSPQAVTITSSLNKNIFGNQKHLAESCETATITVSRDPNQINQATSIPLSTAGTATMGIDYSNVPTVVNFAVGQVVATFNIDIYMDNIIEGDETIKLILDQPDPCGNSNLIELNLIIKEVPPITISLENDTIKCLAGSIILSPVINGGAQPYVFSWSSGQSTQNITVSPTSTTSYTVTVDDNCNATPVIKTIEVFVPVFTPLTLTSTPDTSVLCPNTPITLTSSANGGSGQYVFEWTENGSVVGTGKTLDISPIISTSYEIKVTDNCGAIDIRTINYIVLTKVLTVKPDDDKLICPGDDVEIGVTAYGGLGGFTYHWTHSGESTARVIVNPKQSTEYVVGVQDACATYTIYKKVKVNISRPHASFSMFTNNAMEGIPTFFNNQSTGSTAWIWDFGNEDTSNDFSPSTVYPSDDYYEVQLIAISAVGCADTIIRQIYIRPEFYFFAPNAFTPDQNRFNSEYRVSVIGSTKFHFVLYNRWGQIIFESYDPSFSWNGEYGGKTVQDDTYVYRCFITDLEGRKRMFEGFVTVLK